MMIGGGGGGGFNLLYLTSCEMVFPHLVYNVNSYQLNYLNVVLLSVKLFSVQCLNPLSPREAINRVVIVLQKFREK